MKCKQFQVDAFTDHVFGGNPAAVVPLKTWLEDSVMQAIAAENNLSETAFFIPAGKDFQLRWFTPVTEVALCGHATLATAHVIFEHLDYIGDAVTFNTAGGELHVRKNRDCLGMDFPASVPEKCDVPDIVVRGLGQHPVEFWAADDYMAVFENESVIRDIEPDHALLSQLDLRGMIITAPGRDVDFVSRFFAPKFGIPEDPVTGSAHCTLAPYWANRLGKTLLSARQVSNRGGEISCELNADRVILSGNAVTFMQAEIQI